MVERLICSQADVAIWFTDQALASAKRRHPQLGDRGKMMLPGIDAPCKEMPPYMPGPKMVIGHFGSLSPTRNLTPIIDALESLVAQRPELRDKIELQLTGGPLDAVSEAALTNSKVRDLVRHLGRIEADPATGLSGVSRYCGECGVLMSCYCYMVRSQFARNIFVETVLSIFGCSGRLRNC